MRKLKVISNALIAILVISTSWALPQSLMPEASGLSCIEDSDCVKVSSSCNDCCQQVAVNTKNQSQFKERVVRCRKEWKQQPSPFVCDCIKEEATAKCIQKQCRLELKNENSQSKSVEECKLIEKQMEPLQDLRHCEETAYGFCEADDREKYLSYLKQLLPCPKSAISKHIQREIIIFKKTNPSN